MASHGDRSGEARLTYEAVSVEVHLDPFLSMKALSGYSGLSERKLRYHVADPVYPLPHYRVGGKLLVRRSDFDAWIERFRQQHAESLNALVEEVARDLAG